MIHRRSLTSRLFSRSPENANNPSTVVCSPNRLVLAVLLPTNCRNGIVHLTRVLYCVFCTSLVCAVLSSLIVLFDAVTARWMDNERRALGRRAELLLWLDFAAGENKERDTRMVHLKGCQRHRSQEKSHGWTSCTRISRPERATLKFPCLFTAGIG